MKQNDLIKQYLKEKSEDLFSEIVNQYSPLVYSASLRKTGDVEASKDITQQVFLDFHKKAGRLAKHTNISAWFYQAALFGSSKYLRTKSREEVRMEKFQQMSEVKEETVRIWFDKIKPELDDAIQELPEKLRDAIIQHYFLGNTILESSENLNISQYAMHKRIARGRTELKNILSARKLAVSSTILLSILSSNQLRAVPKSLVSVIKANQSNYLESYSTLTEKIIIMTTSNKIVSASIIMMLSGIFTFGILANKETPSSTSNKGTNKQDKLASKVNNDTELSSLSEGSRRLSAKPHSEFRENKLKGKDLLDYLGSVLTKEKSEFYKHFRECGIEIEREKFDDLLNEYVKEETLSPQNAKMFFFNVFKKWGALYPELAVKWLKERDTHNTPLARFIFAGINEQSPSEVSKYLESLPDSDEKERIEKITKVVPFEKPLKEYEKLKAANGQIESNKMVELSTAMVNSNPIKALNWASDNLDSYHKGWFLRANGAVLFEKFPDKTLKLFKEIKDTYQLGRILESTVEGGAYKNPESLKGLISLLPLDSREKVMNSAMSKMLNVNEESALKWAESLQGDVRKDAMKSTASQLSIKDFHKGVSFAEKYLDGDELRSAKVDIALHSSGYHPEKVSTLLEDIFSSENLQLYNANRVPEKAYTATIESEMNDKLNSTVYRVASSMIAKDPEQAVSWLKQIPFKSFDDYETILLRTLTKWRTNLPKESVEWVLSSNLKQSTVDKFMKSRN